MKGTILTAFFIFSILLCSHAQLKVAITGGAHQSKILEENNIPGWDTLKNLYSGRSGVHLGFMADLRFSEKSDFYFQPGVMFSTKGRNYKSLSQDSAVAFKQPFGFPDSIVNTYYYQTGKQFINYIDLPLNVVYKLKLGKGLSFLVGGGPYLSFFYGGSHTLEDVLVDVRVTTVENKDLPVGKGPGKYSTIDYGVNGLAGFEFGRVFLTANYSRGLKDFYEPADYIATSYKHEIIGASIGIFLGKAAKPAPKDSDKDGTPDQTDKCPDLPGPVELLGCPDTDKDGVTDNLDKCPGEAGFADNQGCPYADKDDDGVLDKDDQCPEVAGPRDNAGCPYPDTDKDGIVDRNDKCPSVAGFARYEGCPIPDTDEDGIDDESDKCPNEKGVASNNGCPEEIKKVIIQTVDYAAKRIQFKTSSAELTASSYEVLDKVVEILKSNPDIKVTIEGHSSSDGVYKENVKLSQSRAESVKRYLQSKGVENERLSTIGYGPDRPLNTGKTSEERVQNRRVELKLSNE
jgi:OOP family OmpA-OmpF porin